MKYANIHLEDGSVIKVEVPEGKKVSDITKSMNFDSHVTPQKAEEPSGGVAKSIIESIQGLGEGIGQNFPLPGTGTAIDALLSKMGIENTRKAQVREAAPTAARIGEELPGIARSVAGFSGAMAGLPALQGGKLASLLNSLLRPAAANVIAGQVGEPSADIEKVGIDAAIGGGMGGLGRLGEALAKPAQRVASRMYKTVLKRPAGRMEVEKATRGMTMEDELAKETMFTPTVGALARKASKEVEKIAPKIDAIIGGIKGKVNPYKIVDELKALKKELKLVGPRGETMVGEKDTVQALDNLIGEVSDNYIRGVGGRIKPYLTASEAQELKKSMWKLSKKVFERTKSSDVVSEGQASVGRALRKGLEETANAEKSKAGDLLAQLNRKEGMWMEAGSAAKKAEPRIDKAFLGRYIMPLVFGAGAGGTAAMGQGEASAPLMAAAALSTPGGRLLSGNTMSMISKLLDNPKLIQLLAPMISSQRE